MFTTRNLFKHYLKYLKSKDATYTTLENSLDDAFIGEDFRLFSDENKKAAHDALKSLVDVDDASDDNFDGTFTLIGEARLRLEADAEMKRKKVYEKYQGSELKDKLLEIDRDLDIDKIDLNSSWDLANLYAYYLTLDRIIYFTDFNETTQLNDKNKNRLISKLSELVQDKSFDMLDRNLSFGIIDFYQNQQEDWKEKHELDFKNRIIVPTIYEADD